METHVMNKHVKTTAPIALRVSPANTTSWLHQAQPLRAITHTASALGTRELNTEPRESTKGSRSTATGGTQGRRGKTAWRAERWPRPTRPRALGADGQPSLMERPTPRPRWESGSGDAVKLGETHILSFGIQTVHKCDPVAFLERIISTASCMITSMRDKTASTRPMSPPTTGAERAASLAAPEAEAEVPMPMR
jgi:hypothetical protein